MVRQRRAAMTIQRQIKSRAMRSNFVKVWNASIVIQSVIRGWLVRRCSQGVNFLIPMEEACGQKGSEPDQILVKPSVLAEIQRRVLKAEAALREKEEENDILQLRLQQYDTRWSEYELEMKSMEEIEQKQMKSLQSSISIAKKSLAIDDAERNSDASKWDVHGSYLGSKGRESNRCRNSRLPTLP